MSSRIGGKLIDIRNGFPGTRYNEYHGDGDFVEREDRKVLVCYATRPPGENTHIMLSVVDELDNFMDNHNVSKDNEWSFYVTGGTAAGQRCVFCKLPRPPKDDPLDPDEPIKPCPILLFIYDRDEGTDTSTVKVFRSENGLGDDFVFLSTVDSQPYIYDTSGVMPPVRLNTGRIVVGFWIPGNLSYGDVQRATLKIGYSDNNGASWTANWVPCSGGLGSQSWTIASKGMAAFEKPKPKEGEEHTPAQLAVMVTNTYGSGMVRYVISNDAGETWTPMRGTHDGVDALPLVEFAHGTFFVSGGPSVARGRFYHNHEEDEWNYIISRANPGPCGYGKRHVTDYLPDDATPSLEGWIGPVNLGITDDDNLRYICSIDPYFQRHRRQLPEPQRDILNVLGGKSNYAGGSIFWAVFCQQFQIAIADIQQTEIRSTRPWICMFLIFANALSNEDRLHFKIESSIDEANSQDNPERFGFSMDGGAKIIAFPPDGVPAVNWMNLLVYTDIMVEPFDKATLTPYCKIMSGFDEGGSNWWQLDFDKDRPDWSSLGRDDDGPEWEPIFEHEATGLPEEE